MLFSWQERVIGENFNEAIKMFKGSTNLVQLKSPLKVKSKNDLLNPFNIVASHFTVLVYLHNMHLAHQL